MVRMIRRLSALSSTTAILRIYSNHITLLSRRIGAPFFDAAIQVSGRIDQTRVGARLWKISKGLSVHTSSDSHNQHLLESESGYHQPPALAKHSTSQNVHVQKTLSSPTSCRIDKAVHH